MNSADDALLVFTDLDGTLLDHDNYSFSAALPALQRLEQLSVPVIINTSKTSAELSILRQQLNNPHPFIVENGSAVFIPTNYFAAQPEGTELTKVGDELFWCKRWGGERGLYQQLIENCAAEIGLEPGEHFNSFTMLGNNGIANVTGLSDSQAALANQRAASEPLHWLGDAKQREQLILALQRHGVQVIAGGRFLHVLAFDASKANAMQWLKSLYATQPQARGLNYASIALGDGANDQEMLEQADFAVVIKPAHNLPLQLLRPDNYWISEQKGPSGWNDCLLRLLAEKPWRKPVRD